MTPELQALTERIRELTEEIARARATASEKASERALLVVRAIECGWSTHALAEDVGVSQSAIQQALGRDRRG